LRNFFYPCDAKASKKTTVKKISSNITKIGLIYKTKVLAPQIEAGPCTTGYKLHSFPDVDLCNLLNFLCGFLHHRL
jgi:hypothetical protein